jgi:hypothetical protein
MPSGKLRCDNLESRNFVNSTHLPKESVRTVSCKCVSCACTRLFLRIRYICKVICWRQSQWRERTLWRHTLECGSRNLRLLGKSTKTSQSGQLLSSPRFEPCTSWYKSDPSPPVETASMTLVFGDQGLWEHLDWNVATVRFTLHYCMPPAVVTVSTLVFACACVLCQ